MVLLGKAVQGTTLGIIGMGSVLSSLSVLVSLILTRRIGEQVARRGLGFDMTVLYHNRSRKPVRAAIAGA